MFTAYPTYPRYRTLQLQDPLLTGEDVYALQTALAACGFDPGTPDGIFGKQTAAAVRTAQAANSLILDGKAGAQTQESLALELGRRIRDEYLLPSGALRGQLEHESGFRLGNYSPIRSNGSFDAGVAQQNTEHTPAEVGFNVPDSIRSLGKVIRDHHRLFSGVPGRRRWALAQGAWNAPAFACWIANEEGAAVPRSLTARPGDLARQTFEQYVTSVTTYLSI